MLVTQSKPFLNAVATAGSVLQRTPSQPQAIIKQSRGNCGGIVKFAAYLPHVVSITIQSQPKQVVSVTRHKSRTVPRACTPPRNAFFKTISIGFLDASTAAGHQSQAPLSFKTSICRRTCAPSSLSQCLLSFPPILSPPTRFHPSPPTTCLRVSPWIQMATLL